MYVILGTCGDTDHEELISGTHKTLILEGVVTEGSEKLLRSKASYPKEDIVPDGSPLVSYVRGEPTAEQIANALKEVSKVSAGI